MKPINERFCVLDIETSGLSARPESFCLCCIYGINKNKIFKKYFLSRQETINFLFSKENPFKYIFAHNGEFDFTILFDNIIKFDNSALFVGSTFIKAKKNNKHFCNSLPVLKSSVERLGESLGIKKMKLEDKFKKFKDGDKKIVVDSYDIEYCFRDCEIVHNYLTLIYERVGKIKFTIASCAMEIFMKKFLKRKLFYNPIYEMFRASYYGGRVECFRFGKIKPIYKYDINSLYPYVCTKMFFPDFSKLKNGVNLGLSYFLKYVLTSYEGCVNVCVEHDDNFVGVLPFRRKKEIIFPSGNWVGTYNFNELRYALSTGLIKITKVNYYVYAPKIFLKELSDYMLHFFKLKNESEGAEKLLNKFLLNALTGKFSQRDYGEKTYFETTKLLAKAINNLPSKTKFITHHFSEKRDDSMLEVFYDSNKRKNEWRIPVISSYITSEARITMLPFFLKYQKNLCYTDTDSLAMICPLSKKYIDNSILGMFKKEPATEIEIFGNKHYEEINKGKKTVHVKGVGRNFKIKKIEKGKYKGELGYHFKRMIRTREGLRQGKHAGMFLEVQKHIASDYTKRKILKNNKTNILKIKDK